ncbi:MAG: GAP family protein [Actinobacteria bacterium]|nr:GAP family protein [Actinomycetota bacterium]
MTSTLGEILPFAVAVTISPVPIMVEILLLFTKRPVPNAAAYLAGFLVGVGAVSGVLVAVAGTQDLAAGSGPTKAASAVRIALGALLLVGAGHRFRRRPKSGGDTTMPKWMDGLSTFAPGRSLAVGAMVGAVNPKNLAVGFAAAVAIGSAELPRSGTVALVVVYAVTAAIGVGAPLVVAVALGDRARPVLDGWKSWLAQNNTAVMAVLFAFFGVVLIGKGLQGW